MANTYELINSYTVGSGGAAYIEFNTIPATYTDLILKVSARGAAGSNDWIDITINGTPNNTIDLRHIIGDGSSAASQAYAAGRVLYDTNSQTSNTFANVEVYIPNYAGSTYKSMSVDGVQENNATSANMHLAAELWNNTAAITTIRLTGNAANLVQYSTAYLYGVKNA